MEGNEMAVNRKRIMAMIVDKCQEISPRCEDYSTELMGAIGDIIEYEQEKKLTGTNSKQAVTDRCVKLGEFVFSSNLKSESE